VSTVQRRSERTCAPHLLHPTRRETDTQQHGQRQKGALRQRRRRGRGDARGPDGVAEAGESPRSVTDLQRSRRLVVMRGEAAPQLLDVSDALLRRRHVLVVPCAATAVARCSMPLLCHPGDVLGVVCVECRQQ
jgi:hypothetical protein